MLSFVAVYRGQSVTSAQLVAVSADRDLVALACQRLLETEGPVDGDPVVGSLSQARQHALRLIRDELQQEEPQKLQLAEETTENDSA